MSLRKNRQTFVIDRIAAHVSQTTMNTPHSLSTTLGSRMKRCIATVSVWGLMIAVLLGGFGFVNVSLSQQWQFVPVGPPMPVTNLQLAVPNPESAVPNAPDVAIEPVDLTLDAVRQPPAVNHEILRRGIDGINFLGSTCGCLPPDTNAAVSNDFVAETTNFRFRVWNKTASVRTPPFGNMLIDESLAMLFGSPSFGDPYVVYDDIADRWYVSAFDSPFQGLLLAVSFDGNPTHGFQTFHLVGPPLPVGELDYAKMGFNRDAIFITFNDFSPQGNAGAKIIAIDKLAAFAGQLRFFVSTPRFQFRAMPPAQMHGDQRGGVEWFVSTDGTDASGSTMRVTRMTQYLSNSPNFIYTSLPVTPYRNATRADQPGGSITTFPNTTTTQVQFRRGRLVTAMASGTPADNFLYPKALIFDIDVTGGTPTLVHQFVVNPGVGVAAQMPSVDMDGDNTLGLTWMESSATEYLSMWVATLDGGTGRLTSRVAAAGAGFFSANVRIGDYSTTVLDPDGKTFWSANEYIGDAGTTDIWRTAIQSFVADANASSTAIAP